jgi:hypothetical protein
MEDKQMFEKPTEAIRYLENRAHQVGEVNSLEVLEYVSRLEHAIIKLKADADRLAEALRLYIGDDYKCTWWERRDRARSALKSHERGEG